MEFGGIIKKIWDDSTYKKEFLSDPKKKLEEEGLKVPENVQVIVHENTNQEVHLVIPNKPSGELTEEQLTAISGGILPVFAMAGLSWLLDSTVSDRHVNPADFPLSARKRE